MRAFTFVAAVLAIALVGAAASSSFEDAVADRSPEHEAVDSLLESKASITYDAADLLEGSPYLKAELARDLEADAAEFDAYLQAEKAARADTEAEASPEASDAVVFAESEAMIDIEAEDAVDAETEADVEADPAPAAQPAAAAAPAAPAAPAAATPAVTPIPAPAANATAVNATAANSTANATVPVDEDDAAMLQQAMAHDGKAGSIKPILPARRGDAEALAGLAKMDEERIKVSKAWEQRAEDERRTTEATEQLALKAMGKLPPVEKFVIAKAGALNEEGMSVPAGTDHQDVKAGCNTTIATAKLTG